MKRVKKRKPRRRTLKKELRLVIHSDKQGKYVIVNRKKYRLGEKVTKEQIQDFVKKELRAPKKGRTGRIRTGVPKKVPQTIPVKIPVNQREQLEPQQVIIQQPAQQTQIQATESDKPEAFYELANKTKADLVNIGRSMGLKNLARFNKAPLIEHLISKGWMNEPAVSKTPPPKAPKPVVKPPVAKPPVVKPVPKPAKFTGKPATRETPDSKVVSPEPSETSPLSLAEPPRNYQPATREVLSIRGNIMNWPASRIENLVRGITGVKPKTGMALQRLAQLASQGGHNLTSKGVKVDIEPLSDISHTRLKYLADGLGVSSDFRNMQQLRDLIAQEGNLPFDYSNDPLKLEPEEEYDDEDAKGVQAEANDQLVLDKARELVDEYKGDTPVSGVTPGPDGKFEIGTPDPTPDLGQERKAGPSGVNTPALSQADEDAEIAALLSGKGRADDKGISNIQIDRVMKRHPDYLDTIAHDQVLTKILPRVKPKSRGAFIINTKPSNHEGEHWQAVFFDARPTGSNSVEFFDSYGDECDKRLLQDLKHLAEKLDAKLMLKFKENKIRTQNASSSNCGHFSMKFILDRLRGAPFAEVSGYNDSQNGERTIERFKTQHGFGYMPSYGRGIISDAWNAVKTGIDKAKNFFFFPPNRLPGNSQRVFDANKWKTIKSLTIRRFPINSAVDKALNLISLGKYNEAKKASAFDTMFHLSLLVTFTDASQIVLEKNARIEITQGVRTVPGSQLLNVPVTKSITLDQLLENTRKKIKDHSFFQYDAFSNNCQFFILNILSANDFLTEQAKSFIYQDTTEILKRIPSYTTKVTSFLTDLGGKFSQILTGRGNMLEKQRISRIKTNAGGKRSR